MPNIGFPELIVILLIALIIFGAGRLPEIGKSFGNAIKEFKKAIKGSDEDEKSDKSDLTKTN